MPKKAPLQPQWTADHLNGILMELKQEVFSGSERSAVLIGGAALDDLLQRMIYKALPIKDAAEELLSDDTRAPLGTFSARILIARGLDLITADEQRCLNQVRRIRNMYAHRFGHDIDGARVDDMLQDLVGEVDKLRSLEDLSPNRERKVKFAACVLGMMFILFERTYVTSAQT